MNYRHAFHAGSFADVVKHAVLARIITHLREKATPFRIIDTHAGAGSTRLSGPEASRTGEWREGIGRVVDAEFPPETRVLLAPYLDCVTKFNENGRLMVYPGSPLIALALLRPQDRLLACELVPGIAGRLRRSLDRDRRAKVITIDGWRGLDAYVPPKERRGLALIDPPFEAQDEFSRIVQHLVHAHRKWPTGIYLVWYPIKNLAEPHQFARTMAKHGIAKMLRAELMTTSRESKSLNGTGLLLINPPWKLASELGVLLPALAQVLRKDETAGSRVDWLTKET